MPDRFTLNALTAADSFLVPIQCEYYALEGLSQLLSTIKLVQKNLNPNLQMEGILLTMYDNRTNLSNQVVADVRENFKEKVAMLTDRLRQINKLILIKCFAGLIGVGK